MYPCPIWHGSGTAHLGDNTTVTMSDDEMYRAVVGLLALSYREAQTGKAFTSDESLESFRVLFRDLTHVAFKYSVALPVATNEAISAAVKDAASYGADTATKESMRVFAQAVTAFTVFCKIIEEQNATVDINVALKELALRAALTSTEE